MSDDIEVLICIRVESARVTVRGSQQRECSECGCPIWVAPTGLEALQLRPAMQALCQSCAVRSIVETNDDVVLMPMDQAQVDELRANEHRGINE